MEQSLLRSIAHGTWADMALAQSGALRLAQNRMSVQAGAGGPPSYHLKIANGAAWPWPLAMHAPLRSASTRHSSLECPRPPVICPRSDPCARPRRNELPTPCECPATSGTGSEQCGGRGESYHRPAQRVGAQAEALVLQRLRRGVISPLHRRRDRTVPHAERALEVAVERQTCVRVGGQEDLVVVAGGVQQSHLQQLPRSQRNVPDLREMHGGGGGSC